MYYRCSVSRIALTLGRSASSLDRARRVLLGRDGSRRRPALVRRSSAPTARALRSARRGRLAAALLGLLATPRGVTRSSWRSLAVRRRGARSRERRATRRSRSAGASERSSSPARGRHAWSELGEATRLASDSLGSSATGTAWSRRQVIRHVAGVGRARDRASRRSEDVARAEVDARRFAGRSSSLERLRRSRRARVGASTSSGSAEDARGDRAGARLIRCAVSDQRPVHTRSSRELTPLRLIASHRGQVPARRRSGRAPRSAGSSSRAAAASGDASRLPAVRILLVSQMYPGPDRPGPRRVRARSSSARSATAGTRSSSRCSTRARAGSGASSSSRRNGARGGSARRRLRALPRPVGPDRGSRSRAPLVVTAHGRDVRNVGAIPGIAPLTRRVVRRAAAVIAVSDYLRRELETKVPEARGKTVVIDSRRRPRAVPAPSRRPPGGGRRFLCRRRARRERKNVVRLADAFATARRGHADLRRRRAAARAARRPPGVAVVGRRPARRGAGAVAGRRRLPAEPDRAVRPGAPRGDGVRALGRRDADRRPARVRPARGRASSSTRSTWMRSPMGCAKPRRCRARTRPRARLRRPTTFGSRPSGSRPCWSGSPGADQKTDENRCRRRSRHQCPKRSAS